MNIFNLDSDTNSYTTDSSDSDEFEFEGLETNFNTHAKSIMSNLDETLTKIDEFLSFERGFSHGDIVSLVSDPTGQLGKVIDLDMAVDLETLSGEMVKKVNSKTLARVRAFVPGDYVVLSSWIGRVTQVFDLVNVLFADGTKSEILVKDPDILVPIEENEYEENPNFYHPGQRVRVENYSVDTSVKTAKWLCGDWVSKYNENEGVICKIEIGSVKIHWILSMSHVWGGNCKSTPPLAPNSLQDPQNITLLSCFQYARWQLGDWCTLLDANPNSQIGVMKMEKKYHGYRDEIYTVSKTKTLISVLWQNGSVSTRLDPQTLIPITNLGDHDYWPGQFVLEKEACAFTNNKIGVVKGVDALERTVKVNWIGNNPNEEIVSAYELVEYNDFSYYVGEIVVRLVPNCDKNEEKVKGLNESEFDFLKCFGNFVGYKDGGVEIKWANGVLSKIDPLEICGLEKLTQNLPSQQVNNEVPLNPNNISTNLSIHEKQVLEEDAKVLNISNDNNNVESLKNKKVETNDDYMESFKKATLFLFPKTAFNFLTSLYTSRSSSSGLVKTEPNYEIVGQIEADSNTNECNKTQPEPSNEKEELSLEINESIEKTLLPLQTKELKEKTDIPLDSAKKRDFRRFDVLNECIDHHFKDQVSEASQVKKGWSKKIQQEWSILENNLPESIYVRAYEERMDLLRACIIGAAGTPYHDGLFFFDILFPPNYPDEPPTVHYHSGGLRLNPNLYESGKVCLSLLKTWTGTGTETWDPQNSTLLQVLLSLQALVLNEKPYFNEAGFDKQVGRLEGEKNSVNYNENAFLLSCKNMMYVMNKPPKNFEDLVKEHFTLRAPHILMSCKSYLDGAQVGSACNNKTLLGETSKICSTGFKLMLAKLVPKLVSAFTEMGVCCDPFDPLGQLKCG